MFVIPSQPIGRGHSTPRNVPGHQQPAMHPAPGAMRGGRLVSPIQPRGPGTARTVSPRPAYSWRTCPVESLRVVSLSRASGAATAAMPQSARRKSDRPATRPKTPPLQTRERSRSKLQGYDPAQQENMPQQVQQQRQQQQRQQQQQQHHQQMQHMQQQQQQHQNIQARPLSHPMQQPHATPPLQPHAAWPWLAAEQPMPPSGPLSSPIISTRMVDTRSPAARFTPASTPQSRSGFSAPGRPETPGTAVIGDPSPMSTVPRVPSEACGISPLDLASSLGCGAEARPGSIRQLNGVPRAWTPNDAANGGPLTERALNSPQRQLFGRDIKGGTPRQADAEGQENMWRATSPAETPTHRDSMSAASEPASSQSEAAQPADDAAHDAADAESPVPTRLAIEMAAEAEQHEEPVPVVSGTSLVVEATLTRTESLSSSESAETISASMSKVSQMAALWEKRSAGESSAARPWQRSSRSLASADVSSSSVGARATLSPRSRSTCACMRFFGEARKATAVHERTRQMTDQLLHRLHEANLVSPPSTGSSASDSPLLGADEDALFEHQLRNLHRNYRHMARNMGRLNTAVTSLLSREGARELLGTPHREGGEALTIAPESAESVGTTMPSAGQPSPRAANSPRPPTSSTRSSMQPQPEEEASGDIDRLGMKMECKTARFSRVSRRSSLPEDPEKEPQPKHSPRELACLEPDGEPAGAMVEAPHGPEMISPVRAASSVEGDDSLCDVAAEDLAAAADEDNDAESSGSVSSSCEVSFEDVGHPRAGEEGMPRHTTLLHAIEQNEMNRQVMVRVPEGMQENRLVSFIYENRKHDVVIPPGYDVGQEVPVLVPRRPPLERNRDQAACRGHANFVDRISIFEPLRHSSRAERTCKLDDPEFRQRYELYALMRGTSMHPLLPYTEEGDEDGASP